MLKCQRMSKQETKSMTHNLPIPVEMIERRIFLIRGHKVMLDSDLAELYGVETRTLIQAVKRNIRRFPSDFMFQLTATEDKSLRSQFVISKKGRGGRRYIPYAFTEQGVAMLSSVLNSARAIQVNIAIMRAFVKLRELMATHKELAKRIEELEKKQRTTQKDITAIFGAISQLLTVHEPAIGFVIDKPDKEEPET